MYTMYVTTIRERCPANKINERKSIGSQVTIYRLIYSCNK